MIIYMLEFIPDGLRKSRLAGQRENRAIWFEAGHSDATH